MAKDKDLLYCDQQIALQLEKIKDIAFNISNVQVDMEKIHEQEKHYKQQRLFLMSEIQQMQKQQRREEGILGQLRHHRSELKKLKTMLEFQHKCVEQTDKGGE